MNVSDHFASFQSNLLPSDSVKKKATAHSDYVKRLLENDRWLQPVNVLYSGSFAKSTHIAPLRDVDVVVHYPREDWLNSQGRLRDPSRVIGEFRQRLDQALGHVVRVRPQRRSVGVLYADVKLDLVPAMLLDESGLAEIPDRVERRWIKTDIRAHIDFIRRRDPSYRPIANTVRLMKAWKRHRAAKIPGFALELIVVKALEKAGTSTSLQECVFRVFNYIVQGRLEQPVTFNSNYRIRDIRVNHSDPLVVVDPVNETNNVAHEVTDDELATFLSKCDRDWRNARLGREAEDRGDHALAIRHWRAVFGGDFATLPRKEKSIWERIFA